MDDAKPRGEYEWRPLDYILISLFHEAELAAAEGQFQIRTAPDKEEMFFFVITNCRRGKWLSCDLNWRRLLCIMNDADLFKCIS